MISFITYSPRWDAARGFRSTRSALWGHFFPYRGKFDTGCIYLQDSSKPNLRFKPNLFSSLTVSLSEWFSRYCRCQPWHRAQPPGKFLFVRYLFRPRRIFHSSTRSLESRKTEFLTTGESRRRSIRRAHAALCPLEWAPARTAPRMWGELWW